MKYSLKENFYKYILNEEIQLDEEQLNEEYIGSLWSITSPGNTAIKINDHAAFLLYGITNSDDVSNGTHCYPNPKDMESVLESITNKRVTDSKVAIFKKLQSEYNKNKSNPQEALENLNSNYPGLNFSEEEITFDMEDKSANQIIRTSILNKLQNFLNYSLPQKFVMHLDNLIKSNSEFGGKSLGELYIEDKTERKETYQKALDYLNKMYAGLNLTIDMGYPGLLKGFNTILRGLRSFKKTTTEDALNIFKRKYGNRLNEFYKRSGMNFDENEKLFYNLYDYGTFYECAKKYLYKRNKSYKLLYQGNANKYKSVLLAKYIKYLNKCVFNKISMYQANGLFDEFNTKSYGFKVPQQIYYLEKAIDMPKNDEGLEAKQPASSLIFNTADYAEKNLEAIKNYITDIIDEKNILDIDESKKEAWIYKLLTFLKEKHNINNSIWNDLINEYSSTKTTIAKSEPDSDSDLYSFFNDTSYDVPKQEPSDQEDQNALIDITDKAEMD